MDFGIGEFITIEAVVSFISSFLISEAPEVTAEGMEVVIQDLLGDAGENVINLAEESSVVETIDPIPEIKDTVYKLWETNQPLSIPKEAFDSNVTKIGKQLISQGFDLSQTGPKQLLTDLVNKTIEYGKTHSGKILTTATIGGVFGTLKTGEKIVGKAEGVVDGFLDINNRKSELKNTPEILSNLPL